MRNEARPGAARRLASVIVVVGVVAVALGGACAWAAARTEHPVRTLIAGWRGARFHGVGDEVQQRHRNDCGPAALAHCLHQLGEPATFPDPETTIRLGPGGCSFGQLAREASRLGWEVVVRRIGPRELGEVRPPAILFLRHRHFVVYEGRRRDGRYKFHDPALGRISYSLTNLAQHWGGEILHGRSALGAHPRKRGSAGEPRGEPRPSPLVDPDQSDRIRK